MLTMTSIQIPQHHHRQQGVGGMASPLLWSIVREYLNFSITVSFHFFRGHSPEWYNKGFGHLCAAEVARIRNSFQPLIAEGPETKI